MTFWSSTSEGLLKAAVEGDVEPKSKAGTACSSVGGWHWISRAVRTGLISILAVGLTVATSGCSVVLTSAPLPAVDSVALEQQLAGTWLSDGKVVRIRFVEPGFAKTAALDWEGDQFVIVPGELTLSQSHGRTFASVRFSEDQEWAPLYWFGEIEFVDDLLLIWSPVEDMFAAAVEQGLLEGDDEDGLTVTSKPELFLAMLGASSPTYFDTRDPMILRKVKDGESAPRTTVSTEGAEISDAPGRQQTPRVSIDGPSS